MTMYWASSSTDLIILLYAKSSSISYKFSSVFLMEHIIAKGNSKIILFTFSESQFKRRGYEYWKGEIKFMRNKAESVANV